jgi:endonuclease/exonuclease/phosphatase family metal-dependent hydrolase
MRFNCVLLPALLSAVCGWAIAADHSANVAVLTQNLDDGSDLTYIVAASMNLIPGFSVADAVDLTYQELQASNFAGRAALIARQIALHKPDVVALQEASLWRTGPSPDQAAVVLFDETALLLQALNAAGAPYDLVAVNVVNDLALPGNLVPALRLTDRNALLVRSDLRPPGFHLSDVHTHLYGPTFPFGPFQIASGWIAATVHSGNAQFRLIATHLQSPIAGVPESVAVQLAQAQELIYELRNTAIPVVLCGDFNSDAAHGGFAEDTHAVDLIQAAGYTEVWTRLHAADPGFTWPLYLEDQFPPAPFVVPAHAFERLDLFFAQAMQLVSIDQVRAAGPTQMPLFGSDHAGIIAVFRP